MVRARSAGARPRARLTTSPALVEECEAFLQGRSAELLGSRHEPVEAWAWVNQVAHAELEELMVIAGSALCSSVMPRELVRTTPQ
ncbi:MAG TPA: hypothetical protein VME46_21995 [Acidimicrobiales bacterium]|nr:hypothetical protein [Acidimicrobiales bacterium]